MKEMTRIAQVAVGIISIGLAFTTPWPLFMLGLGAAYIIVTEL